MERPEDWRQERARVLAQARVVVVKVGSAVLTDAMGLSAAVLDKWPRRSFPLSFMFPPSGSMHTMPPVTGNTRVYNQVIIPNAPYLCKIIVNGG